MHINRKFFLVIKSRCFIFSIILGIIVVIGINYYVWNYSKRYIYSDIRRVPSCYTALVLGAHVSDSGNPSDILKDRLNTAIELYKNNKISRFLVSGDHGRVVYDEAKAMKDFLIEQGIDSSDIFMDHAGFDTYNSIERAKRIFEITDVIIVTQEFHLNRALYIARKKNLVAYGITADKRLYKSIKYLKFREKIAVLKAFFEVMINREPHFSGDIIPITADSKLSYD